MKRKVALGVLSGVAAAVVAEAARPRGPGGTPIDWDEVSRLTVRHTAGDPALTVREREAAGRDYDRMASEVSRPLFDFVGPLPAGVELPPFKALDRAGWIELNLGILRRVVDPIVAANPMPSSLLLDLGRAGMDRYLALLLSFLSRRVLGQFDPDLLGAEPLTADSTGLYLVETNVRRWQEKADLQPDELRRWLILHETTHAWQFLGHPWLREHMNAMIGEVLELAGQTNVDPVRRTVAMVKRMPGQMAIYRRLQATMTLVEGYSNLVMNVVGRQLLPDFARLEEAYSARSSRRGVLEQLVWRVTGLGLKLRQYEVGERFCDEVYRSRGIEVLNLAWRSAEHLPLMAEFGDSERWYRRVSALG
ncbi:MAG TPA: zinc-dependent metalloprotease [Candidatus Dormibacteraeota bacterium]